MDENKNTPHVWIATDTLVPGLNPVAVLKVDNNQSAQATETSSLDQKPAEPEKKVTPVANGKKVEKKGGGARKLAERFFQEDAGTIGMTLLQDVLIPSLKKTIKELITNGTELALYGDANPVRRKQIPEQVSYRRDSYDRRESSGSRDQNRDRFPRKQECSDYNDIWYPTRQDAERVLMILDEVIARDGSARVSDLYSASNMTSQWTDEYYGWYDITSAKAVMFQDGWLLKMPKAVPLTR